MSIIKAYVLMSIVYYVLISWDPSKMFIKQWTTFILPFFEDGPIIHNFWIKDFSWLWTRLVWVGFYGLWFVYTILSAMLPPNQKVYNWKRFLRTEVYSENLMYQNSKTKYVLKQGIGPIVRLEIILSMDMCWKCTQV